MVAGTVPSHWWRTWVSDWDSEDFGFKPRSFSCIAYVAGNSVFKNLSTDVKHAGLW